MSVADDLRAESRAAALALGSVQAMELAFRLGDEDVELFCASHGCSAAAAQAVFRRARAAGRRPSVANEIAKT